MTDAHIFPPPSISTTYRRSDGEMIHGEYAWVVDEEFFDGLYEPIEIIVEQWERCNVVRKWYFPSGTCCIYPIGDEHCEGDMAGYIVEDDAPIPLCAVHLQELQLPHEQRRDPAVPDVEGRDI